MAPSHLSAWVTLDPRFRGGDSLSFSEFKDQGHVVGAEACGSNTGAGQVGGESEGFAVGERDRSQ